MAVDGNHGRFRTALVVRSPACAGATDRGPRRSLNEDAYWISADAGLLGVADGLGGLPGGDRASAIALEAVEAVAGQLGSASCETGQPWLRRMAQQAQSRMLVAAAGDRGLAGMATTLVLALLESGSMTQAAEPGREGHAAMVHILHVGDSRALLFRNGRLQRTTFDHNAVGDLLRSGSITSEEARHYPGRHMVREVLGHQTGYEAECETWPLEVGDMLVLCTDGLSEALGDDRIGEILVAAASAAAAAASLVALAAVESGHDNATVIVRRVT